MVVKAKAPTSTKAATDLDVFMIVLTFAALNGFDCVFSSLG